MLLSLVLCLAASALAGEPSPFQPRDARVWDKAGSRMVWRPIGGNTMRDHELGGAFEWERDSRCYIALGEAAVRGKRRPGLIMLAFPDGNILHASWPVKFPKGKTLRIQYALTDQAADSTTNGLKFTITATDPAGKQHVVHARTLKRGDKTVYDETLRFETAVQALTFTHDNLGSEVWDVLWIHPKGLVVPSLAEMRRGAAPKKTVQQGKRAPQMGSLPALRAAIEDLRDTFPKRYPNGAEFLARLAKLEKLDEKQRAAPFETLQREALAANPLVSGQPLLYVARHQYVAQYHAIDTLYEVGEATEGRYRRGGALKTLDLVTGKTATLVEAPDGIVRSPCVHFDGGEILFAMRKHKKENFHLFEINADGTGLRQLTFAPNVSDFDPIYLPGGDIVFSSTREPKYNMCSQDIGANLFRMSGDGGNIHQITKSTLFENQSALLPDGRILYKRWEYVDRNFGDAHGFWTVNADGTNQATVYGNNTADPAAVYYGQPIPGTGRLLCILSTHHGNMWGPLAILDPRLATDGKMPILRTWPAHVRDRLDDSGRFDCDKLNRVNPKYETPMSLSAKHFLVSRMTGAGKEMGLYLVDVFGNEVLLHAEAPSCFSPMPLAPRPRPPQIPSRRDFENAQGTLYVQNVYTGTHMAGVKPGTVKAIRIVESPEKRGWTPAKWYGQGFMAPGMNWHDFTAKRIVGTVPVEADGSAYFAVPSDTFIYFQLLDAKGRMVQSMRSGTVVQSGERTGCVGCHDNRLTAPPVLDRVPSALLRPPSPITPWRGEPRIFSYAAEVQPVLDKHCVECHDFGKPGAKKLILAGDKGPFFNASYTQLWRKGYVRVVGAGPAHTQPALSWGARASKLVQTLDKGHEKVKLDAESFDRIVTWIDINAPYYASYYSAYPNNLGGRSPLDNGQLKRLGALMGVDFFREGHFSGSRGPHVSFDRPALSPGLAKLKAKPEAHKGALAIIQAGKDMLAKRPRADMAGFQPCEADRRREAKYVARQQAEERSRQAIRTGKTVFDAQNAKP